MSQYQLHLNFAHKKLYIERTLIQISLIPMKAILIATPRLIPSTLSIYNSKVIMRFSFILVEVFCKLIKIEILFYISYIN